MKFLEDDPRTKEHLRVWSGDYRLITAGFYFWNSGAELQMSVPGLLRPRIYRVLQQCPDLILILCPERWERLAFLGNTRSGPWTLEELRNVPRRIKGEQFSQ